MFLFIFFMTRIETIFIMFIFYIFFILSWYIWNEIYTFHRRRGRTVPCITFIRYI